MAMPVRRSTTPSPSPERQRWDPLGELDDLYSRTERLIESALPRFGNGDGAPWIPLVDIEENDDSWVLEAELPGVKREDVHVEQRDSELVISGDIKERERKGIIRRRTRRTGRFEYRVTLPGDTDPGKVDAELHDGVLRVKIPKAEKSKPREIEVKSS
jgi:HSP20 family protein